MKIKKGDKVVVIAGADKGSVGVITAISTSQNKVIVEKVNVRTVHIKPSQGDQKGGIKKVEKPIHISNVMVVEPTSKKSKDKADIKASRVGIRKELDPKTNRIKSIRYLKKGKLDL